MYRVRDRITEATTSTRRLDLWVGNAAVVPRVQTSGTRTLLDFRVYTR